MSISPDGKYVVIGDRRDVITFIDASTGKVIEEMSNRPLAPRGIEVCQ
jgi:DNA-binding beta-propeller fold protein YncE